MFGFGKRKELEELYRSLMSHGWRIHDLEQARSVLAHQRQRIEDLETVQKALLDYFMLVRTDVEAHVELIEKETF